MCNKYPTYHILISWCLPHIVYCCYRTRTSQSEARISSDTGLFKFVNDVIVETVWLNALMGFLFCVGQSVSDSSDSCASQECVEGSECISVVTSYLLSAVCGLLTNLLCVLPEFTHNALRENHILQGLLRSVHTQTCTHTHNPSAFLNVVLLRFLTTHMLKLKWLIIICALGETWESGVSCKTLNLTKFPILCGQYGAMCP